MSTVRVWLSHLLCICRMSCCGGKSIVRHGRGIGCVNTMLQNSCHCIIRILLQNLCLKQPCFQLNRICCISLPLHQHPAHRENASIKAGRKCESTAVCGRPVSAAFISFFCVLVLSDADVNWWAGAQEPTTVSSAFPLPRHVCFVVCHWGPFFS
jgi:hypothetical protein